MLDYGDMAYRHVVVDGSNIATEGRSHPSLAQLDEAVRAFRKDNPHSEVTVVVDATFAHRIDPSERPLLDEAVAHAELVSPPAGAIGRGDAFLLRIAEKTGATVLSNDSFQEFHGEHEWLFAPDRLVGGKPVPGVGWIFTPRTPVRGPRSRQATKDSRRSASKEASEPLPQPKVPPPRSEQKEPAIAASDGAAPHDRRRSRESKVPRGEEAETLREAIEEATEEAVEPGHSRARSRSRRRGGGPPPQAVNDPLTFITFIAEHPLGAVVDGEVDSFTSHGAFVLVGEARCYVPLSGLGDPAPTRARDVLKRGETRGFVIRALDPQRRGIELALPEVGAVTGSPTEETVEADMAVARRTAATEAAGAKPRGEAATKRAVPTKATAKQPAKKQPAKKQPAKKQPAKKQPAKKQPAKKQPAKKQPAKKQPAKKQPAKKEAAAKRGRVRAGAGSGSDRKRIAGSAAAAGRRTPTSAASRRTGSGRSG